MLDTFSKYVTPKQKIFYGLLASSLFCVASYDLAIAQQNNTEIKFQIQELPLLALNDDPENNGLLWLDICGLKQSPDQQNILSYCHGSFSIQASFGADSMWLQSLETNDEKLSWLQKDSIRMAWSPETKLQGFENRHRLVISQPQGLSYLPLNKEFLSKIYLSTFIRNPDQAWVIQKDLKANISYFNSEQTEVTAKNELIVLSSDPTANDYNITPQDFYHVSKFNPDNTMAWDFSFKKGINHLIVGQVEQRMRDLLASTPRPSEQIMLKYDTFVQIAKFLYGSRNEEPTLSINPNGETFIYLVAAAYDPVSTAEVTFDNNLRLQLYCISADGKKTYQNSLPYSPNHYNALYSLSENLTNIDGTTYKSGRHWALITEFQADEKTASIFNVQWINDDCTPMYQESLLAPFMYSGPAENDPVKNEALKTDGHYTRFLKAKSLPNGDIFVLYLEQLPEWYEGPLFPPQLNIALFSFDGDLKAITPIIAANQPDAWYLHNWAAEENFSPHDLNIDLIIGHDNHTAYISIFNPKPPNDQNSHGYISNILNYESTVHGITYKPQPKFFKITW